jgi:secreted PhoX family phosphatase
MLRRSLLVAPALLPALARAEAPAAQQGDVIAPGWRRDLLIRWGDRVTFDAPPFDPRSPEAEASATQFGWDARILGLAVPPMGADGVARAVLAVAHPQVEAGLAFPGGRDRPEVAGAMQGASLLNLERQGARWIIVDGGFQARRLTATTLCRLGAEAVRGIAGVQGGCVTPWGSVLLAEGETEAWASRLGLPAEGLGWIVELDPLDPQAVPAKRPACGRIARRGDAAAAQARDGRAVVFQTLRSPAGFLFRFTSEGSARGEEPLASGALSVAMVEGGRLRFVPLPPGAAERDPGEAARALGAAVLDAPSGLAWDARGGRLLLCLRGSPARPAGAILVLRPEGGDAGAAVFVLETLTPPGLRNPDTVSVDGRGRLLVGTNQGGNGAAADALWQWEGGAPVLLYSAPRGAAVGGAVATPDGATLITAARQPGRGPGASFERPATRWPDFTAGTPPRSALVSLGR